MLRNRAEAVGAPETAVFCVVGGSTRVGVGVLSANE